MSEKPEDKQKTEPGFFKSLLAGLWFASKKQSEEQEQQNAETPSLETDSTQDVQDPEQPQDEFEPAAKSNLYELYTRWQGKPAEFNETDVFSFSEFMPEGEIADKEQIGWIKNLDKDARGILNKIKSGEEEPIDALAIVKVASDRMGAWIFVFPPYFEGEQVNEQIISGVLEFYQVNFGINPEVIAKICETKEYFKLVQVAWGQPPQDGKDGEIVDHFSREHKIRLTVKEDNTIDYKDLGWLQTVNENDLICDIIPPTDGVSGTNVRGGEVRCRNGRKAVAPIGQNVKYNEDESALLAAIDGAVTFFASRFRVDPLLIIKGDIDTATGNLDAIGDVLINGDIREGFVVKATGNITVQGMVEGAQVVSGGDIQVGRGMNGNSHGTLEAKREIRCKFIENGTVSAGGDIICDTIINSNVSSDSSITVKTGRGSIIGGSITALERIDALSIGNQANRSIQITLGSTANFLREKAELETERAGISEDILRIIKDITYLERISMPSEAEAKLLDDLKLRLTVQKMQLANMDRQLQAIETKVTDNSECRLRTEVLFPPAQVTIGNFTKIIRQPVYNVLGYLKDGEVHLANV